MPFAIPIVGAIVGGIFASKAGKAQSQASMSAAQLEAQSAKEALDFQKQVWGTTQANIAPWLSAGKTALSTLTGMQFPDFTEQFQAPTAATEANDPGYQFRLQEGMKALQNSAAARGNLLSGGTAKAIQQYGQDYASNEYQNVYNRSLTEYQQRYNIFQQNQANRFNRLASIAGVGQTAANQLGTFGQNAAGNTSNILLGSAAQQGRFLENAGAARASGYVGIANAITGGLSNLQNAWALAGLVGG